MNLAHEISGTGPLLVLVHGITESRETWRPLIAPLSASYTVVAVDVRGHGKSPKGDSYDPISLATDVRETLLASGVADVDSALIIGHSMGGVVVSAYGSLFPTRAVINVDQPLLLSGFKDGLSQLEPLLKGDDPTFQMGISMLFDSMYGQLSGSELERIKTNRKADQEVVLGIWGTVFDSSVEELDAQVDALIGGITVPYLEIQGIDPGAEYETWLKNAIPTSTYELWPDLGHYPHLIEQQKFVQRVREFDPL